MIRIFSDQDKDKVVKECNDFIQKNKVKVVKTKFRQTLIAKAWTNQDQSVRAWIQYSVFLEYDV